LTRSSPNPQAGAAASQALSAGLVAAIVSGTVLLFYIDMHTPRGVIDGIGYAGIVALCTRFGRRALVGYAAAATVLIVTAPVFIPNEGIGWIGEIANRFFALLSLWTVSLVLSNRLKLERSVAANDEAHRLQREALQDLLRKANDPALSFAERIQCVTETAAQMLRAQRVVVFNMDKYRDVGQCLDYYMWPEHKHGQLPNIEPNRSQAWYQAMMRSHLVSADDVHESEVFLQRRGLFDDLGVRAVISAGIFLQGRLAGILAIAQTGTPRRWTYRELSFARGMANMASMMFSAESTDQIIAALEMVDEGLYATSNQGSLAYANRAAREMASLAAGRPAASGPMLVSALPQPDEPLTRSSDMHEMTVAGRNLEVRRSRLPEGGIVTRVSDVTERNAAQREREALQTRLTQTEKLHAIGQLAGGVAHDFNNILASIMGFAGFLQKDLPERSEQRGFANRILSACERGKDLVNQILDFARTRSVERSLVDMKRVVAQCEQLVAPMMPLTISFVARACDCSVYVIGNATQLSQLVVNLCVNARDSIEPGNGSVALALDQPSREEVAALMRDGGGSNEIIVGDPDPARDFLCIRVSDTGPGIRPEVLNRIFEPFFTTKGWRHGTGLGLAVVQGVAESHGGFCHVASKPAVLTTFSVYLPLAQPNDAAEVATKDGEFACAGRERVLVVDDQPDIVDMLTIGLSRLGYDVVGVESPVAALEAIEEDPAAWDVVVTDQIMPFLRGVDLIQRVKALRPQTMTILCTGFSDGTGEHVALKAGADAFLRKPAAPEDIARSIRNLLVAGTAIANEPSPNPQQS